MHAPRAYVEIGPGRALDQLPERDCFVTLVTTGEALPSAATRRCRIDPRRSHLLRSARSSNVANGWAGSPLMLARGSRRPTP